MEIITNFHRCVPQIHHLTLKGNKNDYHLYFLNHGIISLKEILQIFQDRSIRKFTHEVRTWC